MRFLSRFLLIASTLALPLTTMANETKSNSLFEAKDIFSLEYASDPQISPDGSKVVYVRNSNDIMT